MDVSFLLGGKMREEDKVSEASAIIEIAGRMRTIVAVVTLAVERVLATKTDDDWRTGEWRFLSHIFGAPEDNPVKFLACLFIVAPTESDMLLVQRIYALSDSLNPPANTVIMNFRFS